jgi:cobalt-zinc-cadmium efflux system protein
VDRAPAGIAAEDVRARRPASPRRTYGYYRAEILSALFNGALLVAIAIFIVVEAVGRFRSPSVVQGAAMLWIACGGLAVNLACLWILRSGKQHGLAARGAGLHVASDAFGSLGAILAGALIAWRGWNWADPAVSVLISCLIAWSACALVLQSVHVLMEGAPQGIDVDEVRDALMAVPGVCAVHDLHVWSITSGLEALSAHVIPAERVDHPELLAKLQATLAHRFGIGHVTIQIEHAACADVRHSV